ncbi:MAG: 50S ribosomal protein L15e [Candidatus Micrarchaeota archaeon]|nr:50S ribosomal protein L15e [Candidatus Micrarchaeota archaeon]
MGAYKYIKETLNNQYRERSSEYRRRLALWRKEETVVRVDRPSNLIRARTLGYKAKPGICIVRVKMSKGMRKRPAMKKGRKSRKSYQFTSPDKSLRMIAEEKAARAYRNMEVLNSYWVGEDGQYKYFESILAERGNTNIPDYMNDALARKGRAFRGLTSAGQKVRGYMVKGLNAKRRRSKKKEAYFRHERK